MSLVIWKYEIDTGISNIDFVESCLFLPKGAKILHVAFQKEAIVDGNTAGNIYLWALIDAKEGSTEERQIRVVGTGWRVIDSKWIYLGTVHTPPFVWHIFEEPL